MDQRFKPCGALGQCRSGSGPGFAKRFGSDRGALLWIFDGDEDVSQLLECFVSVPRIDAELLVLFRIAADVDLQLVD